MSQLRLHQEIGGYRFEGPYINIRRIPAGPGLYAIISYDGKQYYLLDIGYAKSLNKACRSNQRKECWEKAKVGNIHFAFLQNDELDADAYRGIVTEIRTKYKKIPCK